MNVRSIVNSILPFETKAVSEKKEVKLEGGADRDADGRQQPKEQPRRKMTEEELKTAVAYLEELPGVKDNNLIVCVKKENDMTIVYIQDRSDKVIRRITELELSTISLDKQKRKGQLFDRAM